jgi:hypothetical protein
MKAIRFSGLVGLTAILLLAGAQMAAMATVVERFDVSPDLGKWAVSGFAAWDATYQAMFLTDAVDSQTGSIFWSEKMSGQRFSVAFDFWIGGGEGADGMTFAWVRGPTLLGGGGGAMGFDGLDGYGVRFDTYSGGATEPENYVAISEVTPSARTDLTTNATIPEMEDSGTSGGLPAPFHVIIQFNEGHLQMWMSNPTMATPMPETLIFDYTISGYVPYDAYFGFTAATGGDNNVHAVDNIEINKGAYAGEDQIAWAGDAVTLDGSGSSGGPTSYHWEQIAGTPTVTLDNANPSNGISHFTAPPLTVGTILTFELTTQSPDGETSDTVLITVRAKNAPAVAPGNLRTYPEDLGAAGLGFRLEWDPLIDADKYGVGLKLAPGLYFFYWVTNPSWEGTGMAEGQTMTVAVKGWNTVPGGGGGDGPLSQEITYTAMRNLALRPDASPFAKRPHVGWNLAKVMNDGNTGVSFDSWYNNQLMDDDWWGYTWNEALYFQHVVYYQGDIFGNGGWWTSLKVQYTEDGTTWKDVRGLSISPPYDFTDQMSGREPYARYDITFTRVHGVGLRIYGVPGGSADFTSIAELEVYADQDPTTAVADPGPDREEQEGALVTLDGTNSPNAVTYNWEQVSGPAVTLTNADTAKATFTAPSGPPIIIGNTDFVFRLTVTDSQSRSSSAPVVITVVDADAVIISTAGTDTVVQEGAEAHLVGGGTVHGVNFKWKQTAGPSVIIVNDTQANTTFRAVPVFGDTTLTFEFKVDNGPGQHSATATLNILVLDRDGGIEARKLDMTGIFNRDGIRSLAVGAQPGDGFDNGGDCLIENGFSGWPGLPSDKKVQDFQLGDFDAVNMFSVFLDDGDTTFSLAGQQGVFERLRFLTGAGNGYGGSATDKLKVQLVYNDLSTQDFLLLSQDWYLGSPPRTPPAPLTLAIGGMMRATGTATSDFGLFAFEFGAAQTNKTLTQIVFMESDPESTIGAPNAANRFNILAITAYPPTPVKTARVLPTSYQAGTNVNGEVYVHVEPGTPPSSVTLREQIPAGDFTVVSVSPGGTAAGGFITWTFSGAQVTSRVLSYSLGVPASQAGTVGFSGTLSYGLVTNQPVGGDQMIYELPSAPVNVDAEMLLVTHLSWGSPGQEGIEGYNVYRSVNSGSWELLATVSGTSYMDTSVTSGNIYSYKISAFNALGAEGPASEPTAEAALPAMTIREAEDFNYGGGMYPWVKGTAIPAIEAPSAAEIGTPSQYDFWHPNKTGTNTYRPLDAVGIETVLDYGTTDVYHTNVGWIRPGSWWRYGLNVTQPGWIKLVFRVATGQSQGTIAAYWDEAPVGAATFSTGQWQLYTYVVFDQFEEKDTGEHFLRVEAQGPTPDQDVFNFDKIGVGFGWTPPRREGIWSDTFDTYSTDADVKAGGWTIENGSGYADAAWRLWDTEGPLLNNQDPNLVGMYDKYMITDSDLAPDALLDERLVSEDIDCSNHMKLRLSFNKNYRAYEDLDHLQVAEVSIQVFENGVWGNWVNLRRWDRTTTTGTDSSPELLDLSAYGGRKIRLSWHFYDAKWDYWFAIDQVQLSGERVVRPTPKPNIGRVGNAVSLSWTAFGGGQYTVQQRDDLVSGTWANAPGTWPTTATNWTSEDVSGVKKRYYRVMAP